MKEKIKVTYETKTSSFELELVKIQNKRLDFFDLELTDQSYSKLLELGFNLDSIVEIEKKLIKEVKNEN
tara:strand:+ start:695 stop:901 length:207 start_codon:yes stop_codon:yes gene_type:complete